jgi:hypothetical protein
MDELIRGSQMQVLAPWRNHRNSVSSFGSTGSDHEGLLGQSEARGDQVELKRLNEHGKESTSCDIVNDEHEVL